MLYGAWFAGVRVRPVAGLIFGEVLVGKSEWKSLGR
jgi:hypothetical protein